MSVAKLSTLTSIAHCAQSQQLQRLLHTQESVDGAVDASDNRRNDPPWKVKMGANRHSRFPEVP